MTRDIVRARSDAVNEVAATATLQQGGRIWEAAPVIVPAVPLLVVRLGTVEYAEAWALQRRIASLRRLDCIEDVLLLLQHPHTITLGRAAKEVHLLVRKNELAARGIDVHHVDRGGDITYHGPGQLVGYPIIKLSSSRINRLGYLRDLEQAMLQAVRTLGVDASLRPGMSGVWVGNDKICALGAKIDAYGITTHGFALNVNTDLAEFSSIVPCGLFGTGVTSLEKVRKRHVSMRTTERAIVVQFAEIFGREPVNGVRRLKARLRAATSPDAPPSS